MKIKIRKRELELFLIFFLITVSNSFFLNNIGVGTLFQYLGYALLLYLIFKNYNNEQKSSKKRFYIVLVMFLIGILLQNMLFSVKFRLLVSMIIIASYMCIGDKIISNVKDIYIICYSILIASVICFISGVLSGSPMSINAQSGTFNGGDGLFGLTFGFQHKNYFGATALCVFMIIDLLIILGDKRKKNYFLLSGLFILVILSGSRGAWLLMVVYILVANSYKLTNVRGHQKIFMLSGLFIFTIVLAIGIYFGYARGSVNYMYRVRGLTNYIEYVANDWFHIWFGNAEMAFRDEYDYVTNIRSVVGWNGTTEMAILGILVKNGLWGLIGYFIVLFSVFTKICKVSSKRIRWRLLGMLFTLLASTLVETYLVNLQFVVSAASIAIIYSVCSMEKDLTLEQIK